MKTFEEIFCGEQNCEPAQFCRRLFWKTLPRHGMLFAVLVGGFNSRYFAADRKLLEGLRQAEDMHEVRSQINDYLADAADRSWLRAFLGAEVSLSRLTIFAHYHLPGVSSRSSNPFYAFHKMES